MRRIFIVLVLLCGFTLHQQAQSNDKPALVLWEGVWLGEGKFFGQVAMQRLQWERVLGGKFYRMTMRVESGGKAMFEGHAYYRASADANYEARWFDSQGHIYPIKAAREGETLTSLWGEPNLEEGKSTYRLLADDKQLEVVDAVRNKDGSWKEFGRFVLKRVE